MSEPDWNALFEGVKLRYSELRSSSRKKSFLDHVLHLQDWEVGKPQEIVDPPEFPENIDVSYAVCFADCGSAGFIVDGGTQECQRCGRLMYRVVSTKYSRSK